MRLISCHTLHVVQTLEFAKSSVPSMLCTAYPVPARSAAAGGDAKTGATEASSFALFAAGVDGQICSWLLHAQPMDGAGASALKQAHGTFKVGKAGLFDCFVKPTHGSDVQVTESNRGIVSTLYCPHMAFAFAQDGKLNVVRCVDAGGALVLGKNKAQALASIMFTDNVDLLREKKLSMHCCFVSGDVFALCLTVKQKKKVSHKVQFSRVLVGQNGFAKVTRLEPFDAEGHMRAELSSRGGSPVKRSPSKRGRGDSAVPQDFKLHCLAGGPGRIGVGTNLGLATMSLTFPQTREALLLAENSQFATVLKLQSDAQLAIELVKGGSSSAHPCGCAKVAHGLVKLPSQINGSAVLDCSATRRFVSLHAKEDGLLLLYAAVFNQGGNMSLISVEHNLERVSHFAWHASDDLRCAFVGAADGEIQFLGMRPSSDPSQPPRVHMQVLSEVDRSTHGQVASLRSGPCLAAVTSTGGDGGKQTQFFSWAGGSEERSAPLAAPSLRGAHLPDCLFLEWSRKLNAAKPGGCPTFGCLGYHNAVLVLSFESGVVSFVGRLDIESPLGCLWEGSTLFVNTRSAVHVAFLSGSHFEGDCTSVPVRMRGVYGLIGLKSLPNAGINASGAPFSLVSYASGRLLCAGDHGQYYALGHLGALNRLKVDLDFPERFASSLAEVGTALRAEEKLDLFYFAGQRGRLVASLLSYAPAKLEQIWGLYTYEPFTALQLSIHYLRATAGEGGGAVCTPHFEAKFLALLRACRQIYERVRGDHADAKAKVEECLSHICQQGESNGSGGGPPASAKLPVIRRCVEQAFGGSDTLALPEGVEAAQGGAARPLEAFLSQASLYA